MANAILSATTRPRMGPESAHGSSTMVAQEIRLMPTSRILLTCLLLATIAGAHGEVGAQEASANVRLLAAARAGDTAGVTRALADGATPNARSRVGETALVIALKNDRTDLARQMLDAGTDVSLAAVNGVTPLMAAAHGGHVEIVRMLLAKGAEVVAIDRLQKNAMTYAAGQGRTEIVQIFLQTGVNPNAIYAHSLTALMWAAGYGQTDTVRSLLAAGAQADLKDDRDKTALDIAREGNFSETIKVLETAMKSPAP